MRFKFITGQDTVLYLLLFLAAVSAQQDRFCHPGNTKNGKCTVQGGYESFKSDFVYDNPDLIGLAFLDTQMVCKTTS